MEMLPKEKTIALRQKYIGSPCQLFFAQNPLKIVRAKDQYMYDERGVAYLDCINNVAHVGHCHPDVVKAGVEQMSLLCTNNRFLHDNIGIYAEKLVNTMPEELSACFFVNSGSEANDLALRLAQIHTGNKDVIALEHAYHGHLTSLIDISHYKFGLPGGTGKKDHVHVASIPDAYRGKYRDTKYSPEELGVLYAQDVKEICDSVQKEEKGVCAYIAESLVSCGGQIILPPGYLKNVYKHVRAAGGVCIADEVQVGFGRVGKHWWAFQLQGSDAVPDIVTVGKPMGNGHPVAAVVTTKAIADSFKNTGVGYFNTYGGNPVSCAIANAVIDVVVKENLAKHALDVGDYLLSSLQVLQKKHHLIGDVRGKGLFVGIDLVTNKETRAPAKEATSYVVSRMKEERILLTIDGPHCNVIKIKPPMVFSKKNVDQVVEVLDQVLFEVEENTQIMQKSDVNGRKPISIECEAKEIIKSI